MKICQGCLLKEEYWVEAEQSRNIGLQCISSWFPVQIPKVHFFWIPQPEQFVLLYLNPVQSTVTYDGHIAVLRMEQRG